MKEKDIQSEFGNWLKTNWRSTAAFELKLCKGTSLAFDAVAPHQIDALLTIKHKGLYHKISDSPIFAGMKTRFTKPKPCDAFFVMSAAYVVVCFYVPRTKKRLYVIDIDDFLQLRDTSTRKSMTEDMADEVSVLTVDI